MDRKRIHAELHEEALARGLVLTLAGGELRVAATPLLGQQDALRWLAGRLDHYQEQVEAGEQRQRDAAAAARQERQRARVEQHAAQLEGVAQRSAGRAQSARAALKTLHDAWSASW